MDSLDPDRAAALEEDFRERVTARLEEARSFTDPRSGRTFEGRARRDESLGAGLEDLERLARALSAHDSRRLDRTPGGWRARWDVTTGGLLFRRDALVVEAAVLHPWADLLTGRVPSAVRAAEAARALTPDPDETPRVAVVLATSGWEGEEAPAEEGTFLFLVEPAPGGGYKLVAGPEGALPPFLALESREELLARVAAHVAGARVDLVLRGLELRRTASRTGVPVEIVEESFREVARTDEFLRLAEEGDTLVLRRA